MSAHIIIQRDADLSAQLQPAVEVIRGGGAVVFPTDTVYGIGCDALNPEAVRRVFECKGRERGKPLPVHVASMDEVWRVAREVSPLARQLMERFFPGALTLVLPKRDQVPDLVTAGGDTVGVRVPNHPVTLTLLRLAGVPLTAPSANLSGEPPALRAADLSPALREAVDLVIDDGDAPGGVPSTVVDLTACPPRVLREGALGREVRAVLEALNAQWEVAKEV